MKLQSNHLLDLVFQLLFQLFHAPVHGALILLSQVLKGDMEAIQRATETCFNSADYKEGRTAFMEKRPPRFVGR